LLGEVEDPRPVAVRLRLSGRETRFLVRAVRAAREVLSGPPGGAQGALGTYRYYRAYDEDGLAGAMLALARAGTSSAVETLVLALLDAWFRECEWVVDPPRLLDGGDVVRLLGGQAGPRVGALLEEVREAQVQGLVRNREEALTLLRHRLG
ncbi:MAG: hypothetical protein GX649_12700, partial [Chloroflexi bacterium]|nr:hypothetical protein [Chloroflexota bacterium]